jgi:hypothetical protein
MCVMSVVHDHYWPLIPDPEIYGPGPTPVPFVPPPPPPDNLAELRQLIEDFKKAAAAAKVVDELTGQKDCVDPEKATLIDRVRALEERLDAIEKRVGR